MNHLQDGKPREREGSSTQFEPGQTSGRFNLEKGKRQLCPFRKEKRDLSRDTKDENHGGAALWNPPPVHGGNSAILAFSRM